MDKKIKKTLERYYLWKQVFQEKPSRSYKMGPDGCSGCGGSSGGCKGSPELHLLGKFADGCTGCGSCQAGCSSGSQEGYSTKFEV